MSSPDHSHVALLAFPFGTHAAPLHSLACLLATAAPSTLFSFFSTAKSNASLSPLPSPPNLRLHTVRSGAPEGFVPTPGKTQEEIEFFLDVTPRNFMDELEKVGKVSCLVSDCFLWFAGEMAAEMGVPWVALWTAAAVSLSAHVYTDLIRESVGVHQNVVNEQGDRTLDFVSGLSSVRVKDLPEGIVFGNMTSPFSKLLHRMGQKTPDATAVVINTFKALEPGVIVDLNSKLKSIIPVGPLNLIAPSTQPSDDQHNCLSWLDQRATDSVVYIGFGTVMVPPPSELVALAETLEERHVPFLWSLKEKFLPMLPEGFLHRSSDYGLVVSWAPQVAVLRHVAVGAFVTHCGWNSVTESVAGGVPMICRPFFGDQRLNARQVSHVWKTGIAIESGGLTKEWVGSALETVLRTEDGRKMRERAKELKGLAQIAVGDEGSSLEILGVLAKLVCQSES